MVSTKVATPYCGFKRRTDKGREQIYVPRSGAHVLVSGPTETGKTRRVLAPAAVLWGGPAVVMSCKDDLLQYAVERRWGPNALIDMRPGVAPVYPGEFDVFAYDPTVTITSAHEAISVAEAMLGMASGVSGVGTAQGSSQDVWESRAILPMAALLYAASPQGNDEGIAWVVRAVDNAGIECGEGAGWNQAVSICRGAELLAVGLSRILEMEPRQRDLVALTMRRATTAWLRAPQAADLRQRFDPQFLDLPQATLYVLTSGDVTGSGPAVTLLDSLVRRWRDKVAQHAPMERLLVIIDDLTNTAPIPSLRRIIGEGGGFGINVVASVQSSSQLDTTYGTAYADELRAIFPAAMVTYGAREMQLLSAAEPWSGLTTRHLESYSHPDGRTFLQGDLGAGLRWQELLPRNRDEARLLLRGTAGAAVEIPDWTVFRDRYDIAVRDLLRSGGTSGRGDASMLKLLRRWWHIDDIDAGSGLHPSVGGYPWQGQVQSL